MKYLNCFFIFVLLFINTRAQNKDNNFPIDSSYTIYSAYQKLINKYPFIKIADIKESAEVKIKINIIYKGFENRTLRIDVFEPEHNNEKLLAAVLLIHGGLEKRK